MANRTPLSHAPVWALVLLVTAAAAGAGVVAHSEAASTAAAKPDCPALIVIGARGSGDAATSKAGMGAPGYAFAQQLREALGGSVETGYVDYPAVAVLEKNWRKLANGIGAGAKVGFLGAYHDSVVQGKRALRDRLITLTESCGTDTRIFLTGYSQGAQVVGDVIQAQSSKPLPTKTVKQIVGVVLFGDPYFNGRDGFAGQFTRTRALSSAGALGRRKAYAQRWRGHILSYCHADDPICQSDGLRIGAHTNYQSSRAVKEAVSYFAPITSRMMPPPTVGFVLDPLAAEGVAAPTSAECHVWKDELSCRGLGELPRQASCSFGGTVPTIVVSQRRAARQSYVCIDEGFHSWLPLAANRSWSTQGFTCKRSWTGSGAGRQEQMKCTVDKYGFIVSGSGKLTMF